MNEFNGVESTGLGIRKWETGSVRDSAEGKGRFDLIPYYPLKRVAVHFENGAKKYGDRNWEKGQPLNEYISSAMRHLGRLGDGEITEDHASAVIWNMMAYIQIEKDIINGKITPKMAEGCHPTTYARIMKQREQCISNKVYIGEMKIEDMPEDIKNKYDLDIKVTSDPSGGELKVTR